MVATSREPTIIAVAAHRDAEGFVREGGRQAAVVHKVERVLAVRKPGPKLKERAVQLAVTPAHALVITLPQALRPVLRIRVRSDV